LSRLRLHQLSFACSSLSALNQTTLLQRLSKKTHDMDAKSTQSQFVDQFMPVGGASAHHMQLPFATHLNGVMAPAASYPAHPKPAPFVSAAHSTFGGNTVVQRPVAINHSIFQSHTARDSHRADDSRGFEEGFEGSSSANADSMEEDRGTSADPAWTASNSAPDAMPSPPRLPAAVPEHHALDLEVGADTSAIYNTMRSVQNKYRPAYQPDSPYVRYRR
jgi:hypothetical protein